MYLLSKLIWLFIKPINIFLFAIISGALISAWAPLRFGRIRLLGKWLVGFAMVMIVFLNVVPVGSWLMVNIENRFPPVRELPAKVDGVIVLGGLFKAQLTKQYGTIGLNSAADRLWAGLELARTYPDARVIFTGGNSFPFADVPGEAELAERAYKVAGLTGPRMIYENKARNTRENALFSQKLADPKPGEIWLLVTSAAHMPRAYGTFSAIGWKVTPYPVDFNVGGEVDPLVNFNMLRQMSYLNQAMHEIAGMAYYHWRGWTDVIFPKPPSPANS